jgi:hypothetical protein
MLLLMGVLTSCRDYNLAPADLSEIEWVETEGGVILGRMAVTSDGMLIGIVEQNPRRVIRSRDRGATWEQVLTTPTGWESLSGFIATGPAGRVYVPVLGMRDEEGVRHIGMYRSDDNGLNWRQLSEIWTASNTNALAVNERGTVFIGTTGFGPQGLYRSEDGGASWIATTLTANPLSSGSIRSRSLAVGEDGFVIAAYQDQDSRRDGVYRSDDDGETWLQLDLPPFIPSSLAIARTGTTFGLGRRVDRQELGETLFLSPDAGSSWFSTSLTLEQTASPLITTTPRQQVFVAAGFNGIFRSVDDGETWESVNEGLPVSSQGNLQTGVSQVLLAPDGFLYANASDGLYRSTGRVE